MRTNLQRQRGYFLVEVIVSMFILLLGVYAATCLFSGVIYQGLTARCDARITDVIRYEVQRAQYIPYSLIPDDTTEQPPVQYLYQHLNRAVESFHSLASTSPASTRRSPTRSARISRLRLTTNIRIPISGITPIQLPKWSRSTQSRGTHEVNGKTFPEWIYDY